MARWMVKLGGNEIDLKALSYLYAMPICRVSKDDDGSYYLTRDAFATMTEAAAVDGVARECLAIINADMTLGNADYEPVSLDRVVRENDDGSRSYFVLLSGTISGHGRIGALGLVIGPDGLPVPSPEPARSQARLSLIERDERVREALDYSQRCNPGDMDCLSYAYKICEIILEDVGGGGVARGAKFVIRQRWSTADEMRDFTEATHKRAISGRKARHAGTRAVKSGTTPMSEGDAVTFVTACIRRVLREWLNWKADQSS